MMKFRIVLLLITAGLFVASANAVELVVNGDYEADVVADGGTMDGVPSGWMPHQSYGTRGMLWNPTGTGTAASSFPYTGVTGNIWMPMSTANGGAKMIEQMWDVNLQPGMKVTLEGDMGYAITDPPFASNSGWGGVHLYAIKDVTFVDTARVNGSWSNETSPTYQTHYAIAGEYSWTTKGTGLPYKTSYDGSMVHYKFTWQVDGSGPVTLWHGTKVADYVGLDLAILLLGYGDAGFDNVSVKVIPEPATLSLLALGLGFVIDARGN